ncbi:MAG: CvpA family protein [Candidatus Omnitrophica bacterium]|nr:CvpA family protein [Candidatus Omnitrophota bacterium]MDD5354980.1 CvpA family protein [Candidatus Omnitrophota bacterium]
MFYQYISQFNWVDILVIILTIRMCYIGLKRGLGIEVFKFISLCFCSFVAFHFFYSLGEFINSKIPILPLESTLIFTYLVLIFIITIIFTIIRDGFLMVIRTEGDSPTSKYLGITLGFIRGLLISGFVIFALLISNIRYFELSCRSSFLGPKIVNMTTKTYEFAFYGIVSKIFPDQNFNQEVTKATQEKAL